MSERTCGECPLFKHTGVYDKELGNCPIFPEDMKEKILSTDPECIPREEWRKAEEALKVAREALVEAEWVGNVFEVGLPYMSLGGLEYKICPVCFQSDDRAHKEDCKIQKAINKINSILDNGTTPE